MTKLTKSDWLCQLCLNVVFLGAEICNKQISNTATKAVMQVSLIKMNNYYKSVSFNRFLRVTIVISHKSKEASLKNHVNICHSQEKSA